LFVVDFDEGFILMNICISPWISAI